LIKIIILTLWIIIIVLAKMRKIRKNERKNRYTNKKRLHSLLKADTVTVDDPLVFVLWFVIAMDFELVLTTLFKLRNIDDSGSYAFVGLPGVFTKTPAFNAKKFIVF